jgi:dihydroorotate dehydrogenase (NAD+) catalytic subunit
MAPDERRAKELENPLQVDFCGLALNSPSCCCPAAWFGEEYTRVRGFSTATWAPSCSRAPRQGAAGQQAAPCLRIAVGMLNAIGLQNPGAEAVVRKILPTLDFSETRFFANVSGSTIEEYVEVTQRFDDSPIDAIEINISCRT